MIIWSKDGNTMVESKNVFSFFVNTDSGKSYLAAMSNTNATGIPIGEYETLPEAKKALQDLFNVLTSEHRTNQTSYQIQ